ncbi:MAG: hypothetical protein LBE59_07740 [Nevskiaceae bacterium]|jgi:hypothetical protein|nr:hypothetical protein [Nevskiaceae bacterium]
MKNISTLLLVLGAVPAVAQVATTSGEFSVERPTLESAGFDWVIDGDENRNASVQLSYRRKGETDWRPAQPLLRLQNEDVNAFPGGGDPLERRSGTMLARPVLQYKVPNMFSGSLLNLEPGTDYEVRLMLSDPDGVSGRTENTASFRTRSEPKPATGGNVYHVYPWNYQGQKQQPAFTGLWAAYYMEARHADWNIASPPRVQPGDTILVHAGVYKDNPQMYGDGREGEGGTEARYGTQVDGTYYLTVDGTPDKPIVIKAAGDGEVIFDGGGNAVLFNLLGADYNYFDGITVRNTDVAFLTGLKRIVGSNGFTLRNSRIEDVSRGVHNEWSGSKDYYIADNVFIGRHPADKLMGWNGARWQNLPGYPEKLTGPGGSEFAVKVYGQGHVVAYNHVANWHDGIDVSTYGDPDDAPHGTPDRMPLSIDFHNNDFQNMSDNCIEGDGGARNIRVFRNRCLNAVAGAFSAQTIFGGPIYFYRNVAFTAVGGSMKFSITPTGILSYNNTYISENNNTGQASNVHFRNNLFLSHGTTAGATFGVSTFTNYSTSDYNGFGGAKNPQAFLWNSPPFDVVRDYKVQPMARPFDTLAAYRRGNGGQDKHSITIDAGTFEKLPVVDEADPQRVYPLGDIDFRLKAKSKAVDAGVAMPNLTDGFAGRAPDLGALEQGQPEPHYGPRR